MPPGRQFCISGIMNTVYFLLGSNVRTKQQQINTAESMLSNAMGRIVRSSSVYETEPWGFEAEESFYNQVLICETTLSPEACLQNCLSIEKTMGRERIPGTYSSRVIDIDILFYNQDVIKSEGLKIPHPRLHLRKFVLEPLNELSPDLVHPEMNKNIRQLLEECEDTCWVKKL